jgi:hypothetical protein
MADSKRPWSPPQIIWSVVAGVVVWTAVGFSWFGTGFDWTTQGGARQMSTNEVVEQLATICVAQAHGSIGAEAALEEFAKVSNWQRRQFIEKAHWAVMPGSESEQSGVADLCATKLLAS